MSQNIELLFLPNYTSTDNSNYLNNKYNNLYYDIVNKKMYKNKLSNSDYCPKFIKKKSKIKNNIFQNGKSIKKFKPIIFSELNSYSNSNNILPNLEFVYNNIENHDELNNENETKIMSEYREYLKDYYIKALDFYQDYYNENTKNYEKTDKHYDLSSYYKELRLFFLYYEKLFNENNKNEYNIISDLNIFHDANNIEYDSNSSIFLYIKQKKKYYEYDNNDSCSFDTENSDILEYERNKIENIKNNIV
jgi:hypothetical protein